MAALKAGSNPINAAAVASLPAEQQVAAPQAGRDELQQAAKRVREARRKPKTAETANAAQVEARLAPASGDRLLALQQRVAELTAKNGALPQQLAALQTERSGF